MLSRARSVLPFCTVPFFIALVALGLVIVANMVTQSLLPAPLAVEIRKAFLADDLPPKTTLGDLASSRSRMCLCFRQQSEP